MNKFIMALYFCALTMANSAQALAARADNDSDRQFSEFDSSAAPSHITARELDSAATDGPAITVLGSHTSNVDAEKLKHDELLEKTEKRMAERELRLKASKKKKAVAAKKYSKKKHTREIASRKRAQKYHGKKIHLAALKRKLTI